MDTLLKRPTREPWPPARRAYVREGTEKKPMAFRSMGVMQSSHLYLHSRAVLLHLSQILTHCVTGSIVVRVFIPMMIGISLIS